MARPPKLRIVGTNRRHRVADAEERKRREDMHFLVDACGFLLQDKLAKEMQCSPAEIPLNRYCRPTGLAFTTLQKLWGIGVEQRTRWPRHETIQKLTQAAGLSDLYQGYLNQVGALQSQTAAKTAGRKKRVA